MSASGFWPTEGTLEATLFLRRWKGENVSTAEVADVLAFLDCIKHVTVYGVHIPGDLSPPSDLLAAPSSVFYLKVKGC